MTNFATASLTFDLASEDAISPEVFVRGRGPEIIRQVTLRDGSVVETDVGPDPGFVSIHDAADAGYLRRCIRPSSQSAGREVRVADLFCGCGAMSLGAAEACRATGHVFIPAFAADLNKHALGVYASNFAIPAPAPVDLGELSSLVNSVRTPFEVKLTKTHKEFDLVLAGPPCQGHSNLNNRTRRNDPKNALYLRVARFARLFEPRFIVIENVPTVLNDKQSVVFRTIQALESIGYRVSNGVIDLSRIGVAQMRRRHVVIAVRQDVKIRVPTIPEIVAKHRTDIRTVEWAIGDLVDAAVDSPDDLLNSVPRVAPITKKRIDHLFDHNLFDLPDSKRPDCHRTKEHTYQAVYGRMRWDRPAPTITTGFNTMGQGRFVHPSRRRTITPHEAARLQSIPDWFSFTEATQRNQLTELIGNAVPPKMSYVVALELLR